jgi:DNA-binding response OmpR family regulator
MPKPRILVLDDEPMIGALLEDYLNDLGCETIGPVTTVDHALQVIQTEAITGAILDVSLQGGTTSYPVAEVLTGRETPFAFSTGYGDTSIDPKFRGAKILTKPYVLEDLRVLIESWGLAVPPD